MSSEAKMRALVTLVVVLSQFACLPSLAQELAGSVTTSASTLRQVNELTNEIIYHEIALQRINTHFRIESTRQPRLRPWRQLLYSETNSNCTEAGLIGRMALSYPFMSKDSGRPDQTLIQRSAAVSMIGQLVGAAGESFELLVNMTNDWKARKRGFDPKSYRKKVNNLTAKIDDLIREREELIKSSQLSETDLEMANAEGALLRDVRDLTCLQYSQYHSSAKRLRFFQNAAYLISINKNLVGAASNVLNIQASRLRDSKISGSASLLNLIAGVLVTATPVFGRVSGNLAGLVDRRIVSKDFARVQARESAAFARDRLQLEELLSKGGYSQAAGQPEQLNRIGIYSRQEELLLAQRANISRERKQARNTTIENVAFGTVVGTSRMTAGILGMVGAWRYGNVPWIGSRFTAAGSTVYAAGTALNSLETARVRFSQAWSAHKEAQKGILPRQVLEARLATLDAMEKSLGSLGMTAAKPGNLYQ